MSLYNAVNHSNYTNPADITVVTMEDVLYMGMKNDLAILITNIVSLQSTYNPNMPVRKLMYLGR